MFLYVFVFEASLLILGKFDSRGKLYRESDNSNNRLLFSVFAKKKVQDEHYN